jgi:hypothetical protein
MDKPPTTGPSSCAEATCDVVGNDALYSNPGDRPIVDGQLLTARKAAVLVGTKVKRRKITKDLFILPMKGE